MSLPKQNDTKMFTLAESRELLPTIKSITEHYYWKVEMLKESYNESSPQSELKRIEDNINDLVNEWAKEISTYGIVTKGLWLCDFDSGDGYYYCWQYGEDDILFFHMHEAGFQGRRPIELLE